MKIFFFLLLASLSLATQSFAGSLTVIWDEHENSPSTTEYEVFVRLDNEKYDYSKPAHTVYSGGKRAATITDLTVGLKYCAVVRASNFGMYSPDSDEVCMIVPRISPPSGFRLVN